MTFVESLTSSLKGIVLHVDRLVPRVGIRRQRLDRDYQENQTNQLLHLSLILKERYYREAVIKMDFIQCAVHDQLGLGVFLPTKRVNRLPFFIFTP